MAHWAELVKISRRLQKGGPLSINNEAFVQYKSKMIYKTMKKEGEDITNEIVSALTHQSTLIIIEADAAACLIMRLECFVGIN